MYFNYEWIKQYLADAPSPEEAARVLNLTGLETEVEGDGLEIEHTVNRPDAMSHYGVARELSVRLNLDLIEPEVYTADIAPLQGWEISSNESTHCDRYIGLKIEGVKATPSPAWLKERLEAIDQTCHNILVDLTNFLLWEFGHPSHAFDAEKIPSNRILVRFGKDGERLTTLDGRDHDVKNLLCITDGEKPIAFGGVMGGENSEVDENTTSLMLEHGWFRGATVRATGRTCNINSDARHRYERGIDRERMEHIVRRFIHLLLKEQPEARIIGILDMDHNPFERKALSLRKARMDQILGVSLPESQVDDLLTRMDCKPVRTDAGWDVNVPGYKVDVTREIDLIEEVIRFAGFDCLESTLPAMGGSDLKDNPLREGENAMRELLRGVGFQETCTYAFIARDWDRQFSPQGEPLALRNPMNANQAVMRRNILPGMLDSLRRNLNRGISDVRFFETGHVFIQDAEPHHLAAVFNQSKDIDHWWPQTAVHPFYRVKGLLELLSDHLGWTELEFVSNIPSWLQPDEALGVNYKGNLIGGFGMLNADIAQKWDFEQAPAVLELDLSFLNQTNRPSITVPELSKFPGMRFDLAFVLDRQHSFSKVRDYLNGLKLPMLESLNLFDMYEGKSVGKDKRSLGFRFRFQAADRTLTGEEIQANMDRVIAGMKEAFDAVIRA